MKQYSNTSSNPFFNWNEKQNKIPLTSLETYNKLLEGTTLNEISDVVYHFNLLINKETSILKDLHQNIERLNNEEYIKELNDILSRITQAIDNKQPYKFLFGDVVKLKDLLQVIVCYYQDQLDRSLPDIQSYKAEVSKPFSPFLALLSSIVQHKKIVLDDNDSKELEKYILIHNNNPKSIMEKDTKSITSIVLMPLLEDHGNDVTCYYQ